MLYITREGKREMSVHTDSEVFRCLEPWILFQVYRNPGRFSKETPFIDEGEFGKEIGKVIVGDMIEEGLLEDR